MTGVVCRRSPYVDAVANEQNRPHRSWLDALWPGQCWCTDRAATPGEGWIRGLMLPSELGSAATASAARATESGAAVTAVTADFAGGSVGVD